VALQGHTLLTVDLEADTISRRSIPVQVDRVLAVGPTTVVVVGGNGTVAYGLDGERDPAPRWERPGAFAFATPNDEGLWLVEGPTVLRLDPEGRAVAGPFTLPPATAVAGAMEGGLVLEPAGPPATRTIQLWEPATGARTTLATNIGRFVGASRGFALVEGPLSLAEAARSSGAGRFGDVLRIVDRSGATVRVLGLPASVGVAAQRPDERELAVAVGPLAGRLASVFRIGLQDEDALLAPVTGPRAKIGRGSLVWSRSGASLFWVTPDGRLAVHDRAARRSAIVRAPVQGVDQIVAFDAPQ
jgi:hypothetical protein